MAAAAACLVLLCLPSASSAAAPANDAFVDAASLTFGATVHGDVGSATAEDGEPGIFGGLTAARHSVWYRFTSPVRRTVVLDDCSTDATYSATGFAAFGGTTLGTLARVGAAETAVCPAYGQALTFTAQPGVVYYVSVDANVYAGDADSAFTLRLNGPPLNDDQGHAVGLESRHTGELQGATKEPGEPDHAGVPGGHSVWFLVYAQQTGNVVLQTCDSEVDTLLAVYTGSYGGPQEVGSNDDSPGCGPSGHGSLVRFAAVAGQVYRVAVDGKNGATGTYVIKPTFNDDRATPENLYLYSGYADFRDGDTRGTTRQPGEPDHAGQPNGGGSVWYRIQTPLTGQTVVLDTCDGGFGDLDTTLAAYADGYGDLVELASSDDDLGCGLDGHGSRIQFTSPGTPVLIAVAGKAGANGRFHLRFGGTPGNDRRADAFTLYDSSYGQSWYGTTALATHEAGEPQHGGQADTTGSVWFRWSANSGGPRRLDLCPTEVFTPVLAIYSQTAGGALQPVASGVGSGPGRCARVTFTAEAANTYVLAVDGIGGAGAFRLQVPPVNDAFDGAYTISSAGYSSYGDTSLATSEAGEPAHAGRAASRSVWYRWTPTSAASAAITTCASSSVDTRIAVYTGTAVSALTPVASSGPVAGCAGGHGAQTTFAVTADTTYLIAVDDLGTTGTFQIQVDQAPANDDRTNAVPLLTGDNYNIYGTNRVASHEPGEVDHAGSGGASSVWYRWTATSTRDVEIDTCGYASYDTALAVYAPVGAGGADELVAANDDSPAAECAPNHSRVRFHAVKSTTYSIAVDGHASATGYFYLSIAQAPDNDDRADATVVSQAGDIYGYSVRASREPGEPQHAGQAGGRSVWWRFTAQETGTLPIDTCGSTFDTLLAVYTADGDTLHAEASDADTTDTCAGDLHGSRVDLHTTAGVTYWIAVDGQNGAGGSIYLRFPPYNNDFDSPYYASSGYTTWGRTDLASAESGEPAHAGPAAARSVWYRWTPSYDGDVTVNTCQLSDAGTRVAVYTGEAVDALTPVVSARPSAGCAGGRGATVRWLAQDGTTYRIAVDADEPSAVGSFTLELGQIPANDDLAKAATIAADGGWTSGTTRFATHETGEADHAGAGGISSAWYTWKPGRAAHAEIQLCPSSSAFDGVLAVYRVTGTGMAGMVPLSSGHGTSCTTLSLEATATDTYAIAVDGAAGATGPFSLNAGLAPVNDRRADAIVIAASAEDARGTTAYASAEAGEPTHAGSAAARSVWYRWTPATGGPVVLDTCGSSLDTRLAVYTDSGGTLTSVASNDDAAGCASSSASRVAFDATAGTTYWIAIDGKNGVSGQFTLGFPPANDAFAAARILYAGGDQQAGSTERATIEPAEPAHAGSAATHSVWFTWAPSRTSSVTLQGCTTGVVPRVAAYTGSALASLAAVVVKSVAISCPQTGKAMRFRATAGTTYRIAVDTTGAYGATFSISAGLAPVNDDFTSATTLDEHASVTDSTLNADAEAGEPAHAGSVATRSVWYQLTPTVDGPLTLKACGSQADTALAVYTGAAVDALTAVASNDDATGCGTDSKASRLTFTAVAGTTYRVAVETRGGDGTFQLVSGAPANDDFADAETLTGEHVSVLADARYATAQTGDPSGGYGHSLWYRWTAPTSGAVEINTCGSDDYAQLLAMGTGSSLDTFSPVVATTLGSCPTYGVRQQITAVAGTTYLIMVDPYVFGGSDKGVRIQIGPPANDAFAAPRALTAGHDASADADLRGAAYESGEPEHATGAAGRSVWFSWTAPDQGVATVDTCGSTTAAVPAVYTGTSVASLTRRSEATTATCPDGEAGELRRFTAIAGTTYLIAVDGTGATDVGPITLNLHQQVDTTAPETAIDSGPSGLTNEAPRFAFSASETDVTFECAVDGGAYAACTSPRTLTLADGHHTFAVRARDVADNADASPASSTFDLDTTAPAITFSGPATPTRATSATWTFAIDDAAATVTCTFDDVALDTCASPIARGDLAEGRHVLALTATDAAGNAASTSRALDIDLTSPDTLPGSTPGEVTNLQDLQVTFSATEGDSSFACALDGAAFAACASPLSLDDLSEGAHRLLVQATDAAGNVDETPAEIAFRVDLTAPDTVIDSEPAGAVHDTLSYTYHSPEDDDVTFSCAFDDGEFGGCGNSAAFDALAPGTHTFRVSAVDRGGNVDPTPASAEFTLVDRTPAATLAVTPDHGAARLNVTASIGGTDADGDDLNYAIDYGDGTTGSGEAPAGDVGHAYDEPGTYVIRVQVSDRRGHAVATQTVTVTEAEPLSADAGDDLQAVAGVPVRLDGSASRPLGNVDTFAWSFGDGKSDTGAAVDHVYADAGDYEATLTITGVGGSETDKVKVHVIPPPPAERGLTVTVRSGSSPVDGADVMVLDADGTRHTATTDGSGVGKVNGLPDGTYDVLAYANGYQPAHGSGTVSNGTGTATVDLPAGPLVKTEVTSHRMTLSEIEAAGIDVNDPANQHVTEVEVHIALADRPTAAHLTVRVNSGGFIIRPGCTRTACAVSLPSIGFGYVTVRFTRGGAPLLSTMVIPFKASFLKEFFDVTLSVTNLADSGFTLSHGQATLGIPGGLSLAPTGTPQSVTQPIPDVPGGETRSTHWIVRGDIEGEYKLSANWGATLEPFGESVTGMASMTEPLKVWAGSALKMIVQTDDHVQDRYPFTVRVGLKNVADVPVYNAAVELERGGAKGYVQQPRQAARFSTGEIAPGDTFWAGPYILVPQDSGTVDLGRSFVRKVAGDVTLDSTIETVPRAPALEDAPVVRRHGRANTTVLEWDPVDGATGYEIYRAPDKKTEFGAVAENVRMLSATKAMVPLDPAKKDVFAISPIVDGMRAMAHPTITGDALSIDVYPSVETKVTYSCGADNAYVRLSFEDPDFALTDWRYHVDGDASIAGGTLQSNLATRTVLVPIATGGGHTLHVQARNSEGSWGPDAATPIGNCSYVALGDSFSAGEGVPPFEYPTDERAELGNRCHRSENAYPRLLARMRPDVEEPTFVACSGAVMDDYFFNNKNTENNPDVGPQFQALGTERTASLVTFTFGGNDAYFADILADCAISGGTHVFDDDDSTCKDHWALKVADKFKEFPTTLPSLYRSVMGHAAPGARILVLAYPEIFPEEWEGGCEFIHAADVRWLHNAIAEANRLIKVAADRAGIEFVSMGSRFDGHDVCKNHGVAYFNKISPHDIEHSFHPNDEGQKQMAAAANAYLNKPQPGDLFTIKPAQTIVRKVTVGSLIEKLNVAIGWPGSDAMLSLVSPSGRVIDRTTVAPDVEHHVTGTDESFVIDHPEQGAWTVKIYGADIAADGEPVHLTSSTTEFHNIEPEALYKLSTRVVTTGQAIEFDGGASFDPDGRIVSYAWTFDDGTTAFGERVSHPFGTAGEHHATLTVTDDAGATGRYEDLPITVSSPAGGTGDGTGGSDGGSGGGAGGGSGGGSSGGASGGTGGGSGSVGGAGSGPVAVRPAAFGVLTAPKVARTAKAAKPGLGLKVASVRKGVRLVVVARLGRVNGDVIGRAVRTVKAAGSAKLVVKLSRAKLTKALRHKRSIKIVIVVTGTGPAVKTTTKQLVVTIKR